MEAPRANARGVFALRSYASPRRPLERKHDFTDDHLPATLHRDEPTDHNEIADRRDDRLVDVGGCRAVECVAANCSACGRDIDDQRHRERTGVGVVEVGTGSSALGLRCSAPPASGARTSAASVGVEDPLHTEDQTKGKGPAVPKHRGPPPSTLARYTIRKASGRAVARPGEPVIVVIEDARDTGDVDVRVARAGATASEVGPAVSSAVWTAGGTLEPPWMFNSAVMYWWARMMYWLPFGGVLNRSIIVWPPSHTVFGVNVPDGQDDVWFLYQPCVYVQ